MREIKCPHCGKEFSLDQTGYADIVKQVHDDEFEHALQARLDAAESAKKTEIELAAVKDLAEPRCGGGQEGRRDSGAQGQA